MTPRSLVVGEVEAAHREASTSTRDCWAGWAVTVQGYVKVEKVEGEAPFYAYGVINDNLNSDGSFVFPLTESSLVGTTGQTLPVIIETGNFQSELTVTNFSATEQAGWTSALWPMGSTPDDDTATFSGGR